MLCRLTSKFPDEYDPTGPSVRSRPLPSTSRVLPTPLFSQHKAGTFERVFLLNRVWLIVEAIEGVWTYKKTIRVCLLYINVFVAIAERLPSYSQNLSLARVEKIILIIGRDSSAILSLAQSLSQWLQFSLQGGWQCKRYP